MPEDQEEDLTARGLKTELIAPIGSAVGTILVGVLQGLLSQQALAILLICSLVLMTVGFWTYTTKLRRQRAKISKLAKEVEAFRVENSSLRSPPPISDLSRLSDAEDKILTFVSEKREVRTEQVAEHLGYSLDRTQVHLTDLSRMKFIYLQMYIDRPGKWNMGDLGRRYLVDHELIQ